MRRILIDGRRAQGHRAGVGHYTKSIIDSWPEPNNVEVLLDERRQPEVFAGVATRYLKGGPLWNVRAALQARRERAVYFSPESYITPWILGRRSLLTVHDLTPLELTDKHTRRDVIIARLFLPAAIRRAGAIIVPTERVRSDLVRHFPRSAAKVTVLYEGIRQFETTSSSEAEAALAGKAPYMLYVGTIEPRKNVLTLIEAFLAATPPEWTFVLAGQTGWLDEAQLRRFTELAADPRVAHLGFVPDSWLGTLFAGARAFVYVSESEGFGLPVAEAMAAGTPVIHSDDPALIEVAAGAGVVVTRENLAADLRRELAAATQWSAAQREAHEKAGIVASRRFDWGTAARGTAAVLVALPVARN